MEQVLRFFRRRPKLRTTTLLAGSLVWLVGFFLFPLAYLLAVSFAERSPYGTVAWILGLRNYARTFQPIYLEIYWRSVWMALLTTVFCGLLGYPVAYTIALRVSTRRKSALLLLDDMHEVFGMALKKLGYSLNSTNPEEIRQARDLLLAQKPLVKGYNSSNFEQALVAADAWIAQAYNGNLTFAMRDGPRIRYVIPKEGCTISADSACIPRNAPHKNLAHEFINYSPRPEVTAAFINDSGLNSPNRFAASRVERWILAEPGIFPSPASLARCEFMRDIGPVVAPYDRYWTEIKAR
jgi:spermidine/putrescine-binding protein